MTWLRPLITEPTIRNAFMTPYRNKDDAELVSLLGKGDKKAFEIIYRIYASALYRYARRNIDVKADCEEIVQEVFESLWAGHERLTHLGVLGAYLFQKVKYKIIRYFQRDTVWRKYAKHYALFEVIYDNADDEEKGPYLVQAMIGRSIAQLPERCRLAIKLRLSENLSNSDIATRMKIKASTVENYMVVAYRHLTTPCRNLAT